MRHLGRLLSTLTWLLVAGSLIIITGGLFDRPLLVAAVPTGSMVPVLRPGDLIVVLPTWLAPPPGLDDIVVFRTAQDRNWIVHRIVDGNAADGWVTKGDANPISDLRPVISRDVAGVVPQVNGRALRLPRLGLLRLDDGPLSSPLVAGVALVAGIFLLLLDMQPSGRVPRFRHRRHPPPKPTAVLGIYLGLAGTAFLTTLLPAWTLSSSQVIAYEVVAMRHSQVTVVGQYIRGQTHREEILIEDPSPLPLVVVFATDDPNVTYAPNSAVVSPGGSSKFTASIATPTLGRYQSSLRTGVFLPLMPPAWLAWLGARSMVLAAVASALVPAMAVLGLALFDVRTRAAIAWLRIRWAVRFAPRL